MRQNDLNRIANNKKILISVACKIEKNYAAPPPVCGFDFSRIFYTTSACFVLQIHYKSVLTCVFHSLPKTDKDLKFFCVLHLFAYFAAFEYSYIFISAYFPHKRNAEAAPIAYT